MPFNRAPADIARSAAESEAPWAWRGLHHAWIYQNSAAHNIVQGGAAPSVATQISGHGPAFDPGSYEFADPIVGTFEATVFALVWMDSQPTGNHSIISATNADNRGWSFLADNSDFDTGQTNTFVVRWVVSEAPKAYVAAPSNTIPGAGWYGVVATYRNGATSIAVNGSVVASDSFSNLEIGEENADGSPNTSGIGYVGLTSGGFLSTSALPGLIASGGISKSALPGGAAAELSADPFAPFRRRRTFVPVSVGGADITGSGSPQAGDATAIGTGERVVTGSTTVQAQNATATGTGKRVITDQSSIVQAQPATASGSGTVGDAITGSGSAQAQDATATATGDREITGQGAPQAQAATATGVGERIITGAAAVQADPANASGTDTEEAFKAKLQPGVGYSRLYSYIKG